MIHFIYLLMICPVRPGHAMLAAVFRSPLIFCAHFQIFFFLIKPCASDHLESIFYYGHCARLLFIFITMLTVIDKYK